jgi:hypothetical protein
MATCTGDQYVQNIERTECIGNSLVKINNNFKNLDVAVCELENRSSIPSLNFCFRNKLINAQGLINQRGYISGATTTQANQYTVDRWRVVTSGQNLSFLTSQNIATFTAPAGGVEQVVEGLNVESGTYVLNWTGTATATVNGTARTKGETFTLTGGSNVTVSFVGGTFSLPQLEKGNVPTVFEHRPIGTELALCQRYLPAYNYTSGYETICLGRGHSTPSYVSVLFQFITTPRIPPTGVSVSGTFLVSGVPFSTATFQFLWASLTVGHAQLGGGSGVISSAVYDLQCQTAGSRILWTGCEL